MKKWLLVLVMPSGGMWVLGERQNTLALFPAEQGKEQVFKGIFGFDTREAALEWMKKSGELNPKSAELMERVVPMLGEELQ